MKMIPFALEPDYAKTESTGYFLTLERYLQNVCKRLHLGDSAPCSNTCDKDNSQTTKTTEEAICENLSTINHRNYNSTRAIDY